MTADLLKRFFFPWGLLLVLALTHLVFPSYDVGVNATSRLSAMTAMVEDGRFHIDPYKSWTTDWAAPPDGHTYSNKAPGPILLGLPLFYLLYETLNQETSKPYDRMLRTFYARHLIGYVLSVVYQLLPTLLLLFYVWKKRERLFASSDAGPWAWFALAVGLGNSSALFMTTWFGHAFASWLALAAFVALIEGRFFWMSLLASLSLLSDYGSAFVLLPLLMAALADRERWMGRLKPIALGGLVPGLLWIWYHVVCFGSPLNLPTRFQNPVYVDVNEAGNVGGVFHALPKPAIVYELLFGPSRGLLVTQPWALVAIALLVWSLVRRSRRDTLALGVPLAVFVLLLGMNAAFGGWHAGGSPGPRYLSCAFPLLAFATARRWRELGAWPRALLWAGLAVALAVFVFVTKTTLIAPIEPLWPFWLGRVFG